MLREKTIEQRKKPPQTFVEQVPRGPIGHLVNVFEKYIASDKEALKAIDQEVETLLKNIEGGAKNDKERTELFVSELAKRGENPKELKKLSLEKLSEKLGEVLLHHAFGEFLFRRFLSRDPRIFMPGSERKQEGFEKTVKERYLGPGEKDMFDYVLSRYNDIFRLETSHSKRGKVVLEINGGYEKAQPTAALIFSPERFERRFVSPLVEFLLQKAKEKNLHFTMRLPRWGLDLALGSAIGRLEHEELGVDKKTALDSVRDEKYSLEANLNGWQRQLSAIKANLEAKAKWDLPGMFNKIMRWHSLERERVELDFILEHDRASLSDEEVVSVEYQKEMVEKEFTELKNEIDPVLDQKRAELLEMATAYTHEAIMKSISKAQEGLETEIRGLVVKKIKAPAQEAEEFEKQIQEKEAEKARYDIFAAQRKTEATEVLASLSAKTLELAAMPTEVDASALAPEEREKINALEEEYGALKTRLAKIIDEELASLHKNVEGAVNRKKYFENDIARLGRIPSYIEGIEDRLTEVKAKEGEFKRVVEGPASEEEFVEEVTTEVARPDALAIYFNANQNEELLEVLQDLKANKKLYEDVFGQRPWSAIGTSQIRLMAEKKPEVLGGVGILETHLDEDYYARFAMTMADEFINYLQAHKGKYNAEAILTETLERMDRSTPWDVGLKAQSPFNVFVGKK